MKLTKLFMDTVVEIKVHSTASSDRQKQKIDHAFQAFRKVEDACSRFSPDSELILACKNVGKAVPISPFLYEPLRFALEMAKWTNGLFDPAIGKWMEEQGFNRHYLTREKIHSHSEYIATYKDIVLDENNKSLYLKNPVVIDLGAIAKGFAIDLAARELQEFEGFMINAGGDLFAGGVDENGLPWEIGIQHPHHKEMIIDRIILSNEAICTSGNYERGQHLVDPIMKRSPAHMLSSSVIAPYAMLADAFATISFLMSLQEAESIIRNADLKAIFITPDLNIKKVGVK